MAHIKRRYWFYSRKYWYDRLILIRRKLRLDIIVCKIYRLCHRSDICLVRWLCNNYGFHWRSCSSGDSCNDWRFWLHSTRKRTAQSINTAQNFVFSSGYFTSVLNSWKTNDWTVRTCESVKADHGDKITKCDGIVIYDQTGTLSSTNLTYSIKSGQSNLLNRHRVIQNTYILNVLSQWKFPNPTVVSRWIAHTNLV